MDHDPVWKRPIKGEVHCGGPLAGRRDHSNFLHEWTVQSNHVPEGSSEVEERVRADRRSKKCFRRSSCRSPKGD